MPQAMVSGLFCIMFSLIAGVGITQMQLADMNSPRNIFILGKSSPLPRGLILSIS